jgi:hypothetical protein
MLPPLRMIFPRLTVIRVGHAYFAVSAVFRWMTFGGIGSIFFRISHRRSFLIPAQANRMKPGVDFSAFHRRHHSFRFRVAIQYIYKVSFLKFHYSYSYSVLIILVIIEIERRIYLLFRLLPLVSGTVFPPYSAVLHMCSCIIDLPVGAGTALHHLALHDMQRRKLRYRPCPHFHYRPSIC